MGRERTDAKCSQGDRNKEDEEINTLRNLTVFPHKASVDVLAVGKDRFPCYQVLETRNNLTTVVKDSMGDGSSVNGEEYAVDEGVAGGEVSRRISFVTCLVKRRVIFNDLQHLVDATSVVPNMVVVDGDISGVPGVCIPNREDYWGGEEGTKKTVEGAVEWADERVACDSELVPIPGGEGINAKTAETAGNRSQLDIIGGDPGHPVEIGHGLNDVVWEPEVDEHGRKAVHEPPHLRDGPSVNDLVGLCMEGALCNNGVRGYQIHRRT